jgi:hypothetical protein
MSNNVLQLAKGQMYKISFTMMSLYKGENRKLCTPPPSNSRWIHYIEFGKKKTMLS